MKKILIVFFVLIVFSMVGSTSSPAASSNSAEHSGRKSGWIGILIRDVNKKNANKDNGKTGDGAYVTEVIDDSPADSAGIKEGDIITRFADKDIHSAGSLKKAVQQSMPGDKKSVTLIRKGEEKKFILAIGASKIVMRKNAYGGWPFANFPMFFHERILGMKLLSLTDQLAEYFAVPDDEGVLIQDVHKGTSGADAGLKAGDVIVRIGKRSVGSVEDVFHELTNYDEGDTINVQIIRKGQSKTVSVELKGDDMPNNDFHLFMKRPYMHYFDHNGNDDEEMNRKSEEY